MKTYGKLENGKIEFMRYSSNSSPIEYDENHKVIPIKKTTEEDIENYAIANGFLEVVLTKQSGSGIVSWAIVDGKIIQVWTPLNSDKKREIAYMSTKSVIYGGSEYTVDEANIKALRLWAENRTEECDALRVLIQIAKESIREQII